MVALLPSVATVAVQSLSALETARIEAAMSRAPSTRYAPDLAYEAYVRATDASVLPMIAMAQDAWGVMRNGLREEALGLFLQQVLPPVAQVAMQVASLTSVFLSRRSGTSPVTFAREELFTRGTPLEQVYSRPFVAARHALSKGMAMPDALDIGAQRLDQIVRTDLQTAKTHAARKSLQRAGIERYRRRTRSAKPCRMCLIASTRIYATKNLMPIHVRCMCDVDVLPKGWTQKDLNMVDIPEEYLVEGPRGGGADMVDVFQGIEMQKLQQGFDLAWENLLEVREHGEIGPMLTWKAHEFTGPPTGFETYQAVRLVGKELEPFTAPVQTLDELKEAWLRKHPDIRLTHLDRAEFTNPTEERMATLAFRDFLTGVDQTVSRYPELVNEVKEIQWGRTQDMYHGEFASAETYPWSYKATGEIGGTERILVNGDMMRNPDAMRRFQRQWERSHPLDRGDQPYAVTAPNTPFMQATGVHEMGHVVANKGGKRIEARAEDIARRMAEEDGAFSYTQWLEQQTTNYGGGSGAEMVAEAFADVELNGAYASDLSKSLHANALLEADLDPVAIPDPVTFTPYRSDEVSPSGLNAYEDVRANGGVTIDLYGREPDTGFAYAPENNTEVVFPLDEFTAGDIDFYVDENRTLLAQPGAHLGMWVENDKVYLDVSRVADPTAATIAKAQASQQLAVFDLQGFETINVGRFEDGTYVPLGTPSDLLDQYRRQVAGAGESRSGASPFSVRGSTEARPVTWDGPPLADPLAEDHFAVDRASSMWKSDNFDMLKDDMRRGARRAQTVGYDPADKTTWPTDTTVHRSETDGAVLLAYAAQSEPTNRPLYRGLVLNPDEVAQFEVGGEVSMPLSSFAVDESEARIRSGVFASEQERREGIGMWESADIEGKTEAVVIELERGAKVANVNEFERTLDGYVQAPLRSYDEAVTLGQFEVLEVKQVRAMDESGNRRDYTRVTVRQTSMLEAAVTDPEVDAVAVAIPEIEIKPPSLQWDGPPVGLPSYGGDRHKEVDLTWAGVEYYDTAKEHMRRGARIAQTEGFDREELRSLRDENGKLRKAFVSPVTERDAEVFGKEMVARAVHAKPSTRNMWRGMVVTEDQLSQMLQNEPGTKVSLPLSSFAKTRDQALDFTGAYDWRWHSEDVPANGVPVLFKLEKGAKLAPILNHAEYIGFGQFEVVKVTKGKLPTITLRQVSLRERIDTAAAALDVEIPEIEVFTDPLINTGGIVPPRVREFKPLTGIANVTRDGVGPVPADAPSLDEARDFTELKRIWGQRHSRVMLHNIGEQGQDFKTTKDFLRGVDDTLTDNPGLVLLDVRVADLREGRIAETRPLALEKGQARAGSSAVVFNRKYLKDPAQLAMDVDIGSDVGVTPTLFDADPAYRVTVHEMGHVIDQNTTRADGSRVSDAVEDRLRAVHAKTAPGTDYDAWRQQYFADNAYISGREAIADAYMEVQILGDDASEAAKALADLLEEDFGRVATRKASGATKPEPVVDVPTADVEPTAPILERVQAATTDPGYEDVLARIPGGTTIRPVYKTLKDGTPVEDPIYRQVKKGRSWVDTDEIIGYKPRIDVAATLAAVPDEVLKQNWRIAMESADDWAKKAGAVWYPELGEVAEHWAKKYAEPFRKQFGRNPTREDVAVIFATYSENNSWAGNLLGVRQFLEGTSTSFHRKKARAAVEYEGGALAWLKDHGSPKIYNFGSNIAGRYGQATVDRWVSRIMLHTNDYEFADNVWGAQKTTKGVKSRPGYERFERILKELTAEYPDLDTAALQAIPWVHVVGPRGAVTYTEVAETVTPGVGSHTAINKALSEEVARRFGSADSVEIRDPLLDLLDEKPRTTVDEIMGLLGESTEPVKDVVPQRPAEEPIAGVKPGEERWYKHLMETEDRSGAAHLTMPTEMVDQYKEYERSPEMTATLKKAIEDGGGIRTPLWISTDGEKALLVEGNHRLAVAKELGIKDLPVRITYDKNVLANEGNPPVPLDPALKRWLAEHPEIRNIDGLDVKAPPRTIKPGLKVGKQQVELRYWDDIKAVTEEFGKYDEPFGTPAVSAHLGDKMIGYVEWVPEYTYKGADNRAQGEIAMIKTEEEFRRKGVAMAMYDFAAKHEPKLHHSELLSGDGAEFAEAERARKKRKR